LKIAADVALTANILVVDDDPTIREYVRLHLASANFEVEVAGDGETAYEMALLHPPDLILSDISMPNMDGFQFLEKIRACPVLADIPIILLTQHSDASVFRRGMDLGADDFLAKPVRRKDLLTSISSRLKRLEGMRRAVENIQPTPTMRIHEETDAKAAAVVATVDDVASSVTSVPTSSPTRVKTGPMPLLSEPESVLGTVLVSGIANFCAFAKRLNAEEIAELLNAYFAKACEPLLEQSGWIVKFEGSSVVAMFDAARGQEVSHAQRALKAALLMIKAAHDFDSWVKQRFANRALPAFSIGVGVHSGIILVSPDGQQAANVSGETVTLAADFEKLTKECFWSIVASDDTMALGGVRIMSGQTSQTPRPANADGSDSIEQSSSAAMIAIAEVMGLLPRADSADQDKPFYNDLESAVVANSEALANQTYDHADESDALSKFEHELQRINGAANSPNEIQLQGYRLIKKLGEGGMSQVFLAEYSATGAQHVLKLIHITEDDDGDMLQRFISEYALISQIDHPNVAKIFTQGFSASHAYIAMEYFPGGDLRRLMSDDIAIDVALAVLMQIAGALGAIHERGIVHRDMKPDNIMIRADGSLALADFGIATLKDTRLAKTAHGEVFGTPAYIAPEQASAQPTDHRADLYALGVMFFELLTGQKPYRASTTEALLYQHVNLAIPELPAQFSQLQPLINAMMAKKPEERVANAGLLIDMALEISEQSF
jgi:serine/threonine-protein kinase PpkA